MDEVRVQEVVERTVQAADTEESPEKGLIVMSTGAVLRPLRLPDLIMQRLWAEHPTPKPPMVEVESGGKKWMEANPDDPAYQETLDQRNLELGEALLRLMLLKGMHIEVLPLGVPVYEEDDEWVEEFETLGAVIPTTKTARWLEWVRYRVLPTSADLAKLQEACSRLSGVSEEEIQAAMERFRRAVG